VRRVAVKRSAQRARTPCCLHERLAMPRWPLREHHSDSDQRGRGCLEICGERITNTVLGVQTPRWRRCASPCRAFPSVSWLGSSRSSLELCDERRWRHVLGLGDISTLFAECNSVCECSVCPGTPKAAAASARVQPDSLTVGQCIDALDCFNNGGHPSLSDGSCTFDSKTVRTRPVQPDIGLCFKPPGLRKLERVQRREPEPLHGHRGSTPKSPGNETACKLCVGGTNAGKPCAQNAECSGVIVPLREPRTVGPRDVSHVISGMLHRRME